MFGRFLGRGSADLPQSLESLTHSARARALAELGVAAAAGDRVAGGALDGLRRGEDAYSRRLAVQAAWGSRDPSLAVAGMTDASRLVRQRAGRLAAALCDDAALAALFGRIAPADRRRLVRFLHRRRRPGAVDALLQRMLDAGEAELWPLLPFASAAFVAGVLRGAPAGLPWSSVALLHPAVVVEHLLSRAAAEGTGPLDGFPLLQVRWVLPALSRSAPDEALRLLAGLLPRLPLAGLPLRGLVSARPDALAELCLQAGHCPVSFAAVAGRLRPDLLLALLHRFGSPGPGSGNVSRWLRRVPPAQRAAVYDRANRGWRAADGTVPLSILVLLPRTLRQAEAHRHLALPLLATRPLHRLPYASLLQWDEAQAVLRPFLNDPEPELRGAALGALAGCVRFERERARDLLDLVQRRRNEPDPVRAATIQGLACLPPSTWGTEHLAGLGTVLRDALDAADLSGATVSSLERLLAGLLPRHPGWAAPALATLAKERGALHLPEPQDRFSPADVVRLAEPLLPVLEAWCARERHSELIGFAASLGRHLRVWTALSALVERAVRETRSPGMAAAGLRVLARRRPDRLALLVPELLAADPSWIRIAPVQDHLHRHRQDLLTPFLRRSGHKGRFASGETYLVLPPTGGFHRWTPAQQSLFLDAALGLVEAGESPAAIHAVGQMAALPDTPPGILVRLAAAGTDRPAVRDAALRGLARRDIGDGLPVLLDALDDGRARIAAYALRRPLLEMLPEAALAVLRDVPLEKVTVAKEVLRLVGELPGAVALPWLLQRARAPLHRDVRLALLRALWPHLGGGGAEPAWAVMREAAAAADPAFAVAAARVPSAGLDGSGLVQLVGLLGTLLDHPSERGRMAALDRFAAGSLPDPDARLLPSMVRALGSPLPDERRVAATSMLATYAGSAEALGTAAAGVRADRAAVASLTAALRPWATEWRDQRAAAVSAVLDALRPDPVLAGLCAGLAAAALPTAALLRFLAVAEPLHPGALEQAMAGLAGAARTAAELDQVEAALRDAASPALRRLALAALLAGASRAGGWTPDRVARLQAYRSDAAPMVAEVAQFTFPPGEDAPRTERGAGASPG